MYTFWENISVAFSAIRMNVLRAVLTIFIIGFGIMALISMLTAVDGISKALMSNFAQVGSNTFTIAAENEFSSARLKGIRKKDFKPIRYEEAAAFQHRFDFPASVSVSFSASSQATIEYLSTKTSPKISVTGADHNYLAASGFQIAEGRNFTGQEVRSGRKVAIIGFGLKDDLFGPQDAIGQRITIDNNSYTVVGYLEKRGSAFGSSQDQMVIIPLYAAQSAFAIEDPNYEISVQVKDINRLDDAVNEAMGMFRILRKLKLGEDNDFTITKSDSLASVVNENVGKIQIIAIIIGLLTLLGAAVGLTNIMLVSVTERTREIGVRKALGATTLNIRNQFLWESLVMCFMGGIFGIVAGLFLGNLVGKYFQGSFLIPWGWITFGLVLCFLVGIFAGLYPALKAARLDPVDSLRHE